MNKKSEPTSKTKRPQGDLEIRIMAMPAHTNANGDIFGGWVLSLMDLAGASLARKRSKSRVVTAAIESMSFIAPVKVGDFVCCYGALLKVGRTSMRVRLEAWVENHETGSFCQVTEGVFTFVAVDEKGQPVPVDK